MDACGKFGEHEKSVRVARGVGFPNFPDIGTSESMNQFFYNIVTTKYRNVVRGKRVTYVHILYLNTMGFKAQSLWDRVKTTEYSIKLY